MKTNIGKIIMMFSERFLFNIEKFETELKLTEIVCNREEKINLYQKEQIDKFKKILLLIAIILSVSFTYDILNTLTDSGTSVSKIDPEKVKGNKKMLFDVVVDSSEKEQFKITQNLDISKNLLSSKAIKNNFENLEKRLPKIILGKNDNFENISSKLDLIDYDNKTGISLKWETEPKDKLNNDGSLNLFNVKRNEKIELKCTMFLSDVSREIKTLIRLKPICTTESLKSSLEYHMQKVQNDYKQGKIKEIILPKKMGRYNISWQMRKPEIFNGMFLLALLFILIHIVKEKKSLDKSINTVRNNILNEIPEFVNQLILLLNAGLIVNEALMKIACDYDKYSDMDKPLYSKLQCAVDIACETNLSTISILKEYADKSGINELRRIVAIIHENMNMGTSLCFKLEKEAELLTIANKRIIEEKIKLAETKITFPMAIQLLVTVLITIAPNIILK